MKKIFNAGEIRTHNRFRLLNALTTTSEKLAENMKKVNTLKVNI